MKLILESTAAALTKSDLEVRHSRQREQQPELRSVPCLVLHHSLMQRGLSEMERTMSLWLFLAEAAGITFAGLALSATPLVML